MCRRAMLPVKAKINWREIAKFGINENFGRGTISFSCRIYQPLLSTSSRVFGNSDGPFAREGRGSNFEDFASPFARM